jgi:arylsulfatase A-like enzyme
MSNSLIDRPNIIVIMSDDQGAWAMGCAENHEIKTPHLDRMAKTGIHFTNFFCASPVCSPARASFLTGKIPSQHGIHDWIRSGSVDKESLSPELQLHRGFTNEHEAIEYLEGSIGYTDILAEQGYTCGLSGKWHLGNSTKPQKGFSHWFTIGRGGCDYYKPDVVRNGKVQIEEKYVTDLITEEAISFINSCSQSDQPFYLSVHYTAPHSPWAR